MEIPHCKASLSGFGMATANECGVRGNRYCAEGHFTNDGRLVICLLWLSIAFNGVVERSTTLLAGALSEPSKLYWKMDWRTRGERKSSSEEHERTSEVQGDRLINLLNRLAHFRLCAPATLETRSRAQIRRAPSLVYLKCDPREISPVPFYSPSFSPSLRRETHFLLVLRSGFLFLSDF